MKQNSEGAHKKDPLYLARLSGKIVLAVFAVFVFFLCFILYFSYEKSRQSLLLSVSNSFSERAIVLDANIASIANYVLVMKSFFDESFLEEISDDEILAFEEAFKRSAHYKKNNDCYFLKKDEIIGSVVNRGEIFGKGDPQYLSKSQLKLIRQGMGLMEMQKAGQTVCPNIVLSYYISPEQNFSSAYPAVNMIEMMGNRMVDAWVSKAYGVYSEGISFAKNPGRVHFWTKPYMDFAGQGMMVSCAVPVDENERTVGVIGADVVLAFLDEYTIPIESVPGQMILASQFEQVISASGLKYQKEHGILPLKSLLSLSGQELDFGSLSTFQVEDGDNIVFVRKLENAPWTLFYSVPNSNLEQILLSKKIIYFSIVLLVGVLFVGGYAFVQKKYIQPGIQFEQDLENLNRDLESKVLERTEVLQEREVLLRSILESTDNGLLVVDNDGKVTLSNNRFAAMWKIPPDLLSRAEDAALLDFVSPKLADPEGFMKGTAALYRSSDAQLDVINFKNGQAFERFTSPLMLYKDKAIGRVWNFRDITARNQYEKELGSLRNLLDNIINSMPSVLVGVDVAGCVTQWNLTAEKQTGLSFEKAHGQMLPDVLPQMALEMDTISESIFARQPKSVLKKPRKTNGRTCFETITIYPLMSSDAPGAVIRIDDVTEQVRMEQVVIQSEKMLSVGGLAAGMAHEINNPLASIMQTASVMANRLRMDKEVLANVKAATNAGTSMSAISKFMDARHIPQMIEVIIQSSRRIADIVDNMLSFARKSDTAESTVDLGELFDKAFKLAMTDDVLKARGDIKKIKVQREYAQLPPIPCDKPKLQQALINIIRNGLEAMQGYADEPLFVVKTHFSENKNRVCLEIGDNGPGMDEFIQKRVFEPFFTTKPVGEGVGLGLSVAYFIIKENHGGEMTIHSKPGEGSNLIICLPLTSSLTPMGFLPAD